MNGEGLCKHGRPFYGVAACSYGCPEVARLSALNERLAESFYLPLDCPNCGRRRLLAYPETRSMRCERCDVSEFDCASDEHEAGGAHPQHASAWGAVPPA